MSALRKLFGPNIAKMEAGKDIPGLIKALGHKDFDISWAASLALRKIGQPAVEPLIATLANTAEDRDIRDRIPGILAKIGDPRAINPLLAALKDPGTLGWTAAEALGELGKGLADQQQRSHIVVELGAATSRDTYMARYALKGLMEMGEFGSPKLEHPDHYLDELIKVGGSPHRLTLEQVGADPFGVTLSYRWHDEISHAEADKLDSRLRAYISCAIYEAASAAQIVCYPGEPHGRRPAWNIHGDPSSYSLQDAGFDTESRVCELRVGPILMSSAMMQQGVGSGRNQVVTALAEGFRSKFSELTV